MTDDNLLPFCFPAACRKKITAAFDGGRISSDGGVMLLAQADRRLSIAERLAQAIPDALDPDRVTQDRCLVDRRRRVLAMVSSGWRGPSCRSGCRAPARERRRPRPARRHSA